MPLTYARYLQAHFELTFPLSIFYFELEVVPVRGYAKGGNVENVEFGGIAA
jgi:hypothetical protein